MPKEPFNVLTEHSSKSALAQGVSNKASTSARDMLSVLLICFIIFHPVEGWEPKAGSVEHHEEALRGSAEREKSTLKTVCVKFKFIESRRLGMLRQTGHRTQRSDCFWMERKTYRFRAWKTGKTGA